MLGVPVDETFRMTYVNNTAEAAEDLIDECIQTAAWTYDPIDNPDERLLDQFTRLCLHTGELHTTAWRKSDTIICSSAVRLDECSCYAIDFDREDIRLEEALVDKTVRGFTLGTWSGADDLPGGCRRIETPDKTRSLVSCDLTALELVNAMAEVKEACRSKYAENIVVHVELPLDLLFCPEQPDDNCSKQPWILEPY